MEEGKDEVVKPVNEADFATFGEMGESDIGENFEEDKLTQQIEDLRTKKESL